MKLISVGLSQIQAVVNPFPFNAFLDWKVSVDKTLTFLTSNPEIKHYLVTNAYSSHFLENFLTFSKETKFYLENFHYNYFGAVESDFDVFKDLLTNYIRALLLESEFLPLVDLLYKCFMKTCTWKNEKSLNKFLRNDPGIYVLYNNNTFVSYIGETNNLERRFSEHKTALVEGTHFNKNLRKSISAENINDLFFFIVDYGLDFSNAYERRQQEITLINSWPGLIYNIKDVYRP